MPDSISSEKTIDDDDDETVVYDKEKRASLIQAASAAIVTEEEATVVLEGSDDQTKTVVADRASLLGAEANKAMAAFPLVVQKPITDWGAQRGERRIVDLAGTTPVAFSRSESANPASEAVSSKPAGESTVADPSESATAPRTPRAKRQMDKATGLAWGVLGASIIFAATAVGTKDRRIHTQPATGLTAVPTQSIAPVSTLDIDAGAPQDAGSDAKDSKTVTPSTLKQ